MAVSMFAVNGFALETGMLKIVLPLIFEMSIGGPGGTNLGRPVNFLICAATYARSGCASRRCEPQTAAGTAAAAARTPAKTTAASQRARVATNRVMQALPLSVPVDDADHTAVGHASPM